MIEFQTNVATPDGQMDCFVCHPDKGAHPAVLFYMDVPGIREELREMCRHIAAQGYVAILPDLYYRDGVVRFDLRKGEEEFKRMFAQGSKMTVEMVMRDTGGMIEYCRASDFVSQGIGCIGYCMSGQFVIAAGGSFPDDIQAAAALYGTRMVTSASDSPHLLADRIKGEIYLGFAEHDPYVEDFVIPDLTAALDSAEVTYISEVHPGTEHGFCFRERPGYVEDAAEKVWDRVFSMYSRTLG